MRRIAVMGCGGSGKTVLGNQLSGSLGIPVTFLDAVYYDESWQALPQDEFAERQRTIVSAEDWIVDGNYASTLSIRLEREPTPSSSSTCPRSPVCGASLNAVGSIAAGSTTSPASTTASTGGS